MHNLRTIVLASASPRRRELLEKMGLNFMVDESLLAERIIPGIKPRELAMFLSKEKAEDVALRHGDSIVIAADTIVVFRGRIFGKPRDRAHARQMLRTLSGRVHSVLTGFTIIDTASGKEITRAVESKVFFRKLSEGEIEAYIKSGEPMDKAGAYGIQGLGAVLVRKIEGDFFNVVGLPLHSLFEGLKKFGVNVLSSN